MAKLSEAWQIQIATQTNGIITLLKTVNEALVSVLTICDDLEYHLGNSGQKETSALVDAFLAQDGDTLAQESKYKLAGMISNRFGVNWTKAFDALYNTTYSPLENYDMEEVTEYGKKTTRTPNLTTEADETVQAQIYGYNSTTATDADKSISQGSTRQTGTDEHLDSGTDTLRRHGNIGVTTSQQMLESELNIRKEDLARRIYENIDSVLCCPMYF